MSCLFYCFKKNNPEKLNQNLLDNTDALNASDKNQTELKISPQVLKQAKFKLKLLPEIDLKTIKSEPLDVKIDFNTIIKQVEKQDVQQIKTPITGATLKTLNIAHEKSYKKIPNPTEQQTFDENGVWDTSSNIHHKRLVRLGKLEQTINQSNKILDSEEIPKELQLKIFSFLDKDSETIMSQGQSLNR